MKRLRLYLETSVWNFCFADDAPEMKRITLKFFEQIEPENYEIFISDLVSQEIERADYEKREMISEIIMKYSPKEITVNDKVYVLSRKYVSEGILTLNNVNDATHAALATVYEMDALISWNFKHLANLRRMEQINEVNRKLGYFKRLELITPMEVSNAEIL